MTSGETRAEAIQREIDTKGSVNESFAFWQEFRPEVERLHRARTPLYYQGRRSAVPALANLHMYVIKAFAAGVEYETRLARSRGASRGDILDVLSLAFVHAGHVGMYPATSIADYLRTWPDDATDDRAFPENWQFDPDAVASGIDFSSPELSATDLAALEGWYLRTIGEVPQHVRFLARRRPALLKAHRHRYERAISASLPKQLLPYLMLHFDLYRGFASGVRENILLAKAFGLTRAQVLDAICSSVLHAGSGGLDLVPDELLDDFPD